MAGKIQGKIVAVRDSGDLISDIERGQLRGVSGHDKLAVSCEGYATIGIFGGTQEEAPMTLMAVWGTDDVMELTLVHGNASEFLGIRPGATVVVEW